MQFQCREGFVIQQSSFRHAFCADTEFGFEAATSPCASATQRGHAADSCSGFSWYMFSCWQATLPGGITPATYLASWTSADSLSGLCQVTVGKITMACSTAHAARYHMTETEPT